MVEIIIHVGMPGAEDPVLNSALVASADHLRSAGIHHLADHEVPILKTGNQIAAADALVDYMVAAGPQRFVISDPTYFERVEELHPFLSHLGQRVLLRIFVCVRPLRSWFEFPSLQGSISDDCGGELGSAKVSALASSYALLHRWAELFGSTATFHPVQETSDILAEFAGLTGITLIATPDHPYMKLMAEHAGTLAQASQAVGFDITAPIIGDGRDQFGLLGQIALLQRRLNAAEKRHDAVAMQLRKLTQPQLNNIRDRLRLAIALDDPEMLYSAAAVTAEVQRLRNKVDELTSELQDRDRLRHREAELLSSTSWRITAPLRAVSRALRR